MTGRDTERTLRRLAPLDPRAAEQAWLFYLSGVGAERELASDLLDVLLFQRAGKAYPEEPFLDPPPPAICAGEYRLGVVAYPPRKPFAPFGLREKEWTSHVMIVGMTGVGKATLAANILRELDRHAKPFLVFDWKRSYRQLGIPGLEILDLRDDAHPFRFNPLIPPTGVTPGEWLMKLVDVLKHAYFVGEGVEYLLRRGLDLAYEDAGWHGGAADPTADVR